MRCVPLVTTAMRPRPRQTRVSRAPAPCLSRPTTSPRGALPPLAPPRGRICASGAATDTRATSVKCESMESSLIYVSHTTYFSGADFCMNFQHIKYCLLRYGPGLGDRQFNRLHNLRVLEIRNFFQYCESN